ncbi:YfjD family protein [Cytobacillus oceanisediminis]|uniref:DUF5381 family protein n=1 Tax=Cytobacillus oceanisediminis TaxID=665099 RepID=UPI001C225525|nr:DUF5381 family protein [Cytobacillus oceanisediminis]MBU8733197.1 YfjD family protein [Cytobacillus oceanisediminis]MCS0791243.1 YfjD family protein [Cytobacillus firmus]
MIEEKNEGIFIKGSKFMYVWMFLATVGFLIACIFLITHGLKFNSKYSFIYLGGGIVLTPFYLYLTLWSLPGLIPGKILFSIIPGEDGKLILKRKEISIKNIQNINLVRNPLNLINDIIIETFNDKKFRIRTYNLLAEMDYEMIVDKYLYPYMTENTRKVWDRKVNLEILRQELKYERKEQKID